MAIEITTPLVPIPGIAKLFPVSPLGLLAALVGTWKGNGFNQIFRPLQPRFGSDNFLEPNLTEETLEFMEIPGEIPNRGFAQKDISLFGMTYLQQVAIRGTGKSCARPRRRLHSRACFNSQSEAGPTGGEMGSTCSTGFRLCLPP